MDGLLGGRALGGRVLGELKVRSTRDDPLISTVASEVVSVDSVIQY